jgi:aldehyde:ferredoxin oxidoreductase
VGAKSPLTGTIKESNAGGTVVAALGRLGISAIIVEGQGSEGDLSILGINESGKAGFDTAEAYKGMRTYALVEKLLATFGEKNVVFCIGPDDIPAMGIRVLKADDILQRGAAVHFFQSVFGG